MAKINQLDNFDSGSNYNFDDKMIYSKNPRSLFDLSHTVTTTIKKEGVLQVVTMFRTIPGDDIDIEVDSLLRVMPQVVPLYSRQRLKIYAFYSPYSTLWNNWQVFMDKGYTGNVTKQIPHLTSGNCFDDTDVVIAPDSLGDQMGLPIGTDVTALLSADINILPMMMYLRIYRDYFMNKNEWIEDRVLLPDDDSRFRVNDNGQLLSALDESKTLIFDISGTNNDISISGSTYTVGCLYHEYADDYFTTALPFTQRGTAPFISKNLDTSNLSISFADVVGNGSTSQGGTAKSYILGYDPTTKTMGFLSRALGHGTGASGDRIGFEEGFNNINDNWTANGNNFSANAQITGDSTIIDTFNKVKINGSNVGIKLFLEELRGLAVNQQILEQLARTDGSYAQFGLSFFGEKPRNANDYRPTYIGGTYKNIVFTEVLQTSGTQIQNKSGTDTDVGTPLGAMAGHGITGMKSNRIGHIHADDYGLVMILACIMPDVYYSQGLEKLFTDKLQDEMYLPDRAKLGMQPILNKELYYAGNNGNSIGDDNYLWAYQNPFDDYRYIPNRIKGKIADPNSKSFFPYTQSRKFSQLPNWGHEFSVASPNNVRSDYLYAPDEDHYTAQFSFNIRAVRPLPYKPIPARIV